MTIRGEDLQRLHVLFNLIHTNRGAGYKQKRLCYNCIVDVETIISISSVLKTGI